MTEALETSSSPATLALEKAGGSLLKLESPARTAKTVFAASDSLQSLLSMGNEAVEQVAGEEEEDFGFPSIEWLADDEDDTSTSSSGDPLGALSNALALIKEDCAFQRSSSKSQSKRRRMGEHQGMVRSKAMQNSLSSLGNSCSKESGPAVNNNTAKFVLGTWGSLVTAREVTHDMATCSLKNSPFDTAAAAINCGLLTV